MPPAPSGEHDLLPGNPITPENIGSFCRVIGCVHHNYGIPSFPAGVDGFQKACDRGLIFHQPFSSTLLEDALASIRWYRCIGACNDYHMGAESHQLHMKGCNIYQEHLLNLAEAEAARVREAVGAAEAAGAAEAQYSESFHSPVQQAPSSTITDPKLLALYNATPREGQPEFLTKMERGGRIEALQAIVIRWMMTATAGAHVNA